MAHHPRCEPGFVTDDANFIPRPPPYTATHWGMRVAFQNIVPKTLAAMGAPEWAPVLEAWWDRYDGLEVYLGSLGDHRVMGSQRLRELAEEGPVTAERLAEALVDLGHTHYTARRYEDADYTWNPLNCRFADFAQGMREQGKLSLTGAHLVYVRELDRPYPSRDILESWLMARLVRAQLDARGEEGEGR